MEWTLLATSAMMLLLIGYKLLSGQIIFSGLIRARLGQGFDFHRIQFLAVTLLFAFGYLWAGFARHPGEGMPDISPVILLPLLGSHAAYLTGKVLDLGKDTT